jgi:hypothetical protein
MRTMFGVAIGLAGFIAWQANGTLAVYQTGPGTAFATGGYDVALTADLTGTTDWLVTTRTDFNLWAGYSFYGSWAVSPAGENNFAWYPYGYGNSFSAQLDSDFYVPVAGRYAFGTYSDDSSHVYIDDNPNAVVINRGTPYGGWENPPQDGMGWLDLTAGIHHLKAQYCENGVGSANFTVYIDARLTPTAVPEPSTVVAGGLLLLSFGMQGIRYLRTRKQTA